MTLTSMVEVEIEGVMKHVLIQHTDTLEPVQDTTKDPTSLETLLCYIAVRERPVTKDGKPAESDLGKRYLCGHVFGTGRFEQKDGETGEEIVIYATGIVRSLTGPNNVYLGCGTEFLCTKAGEGYPYCHNTAATLIKPKPLPSSD